VIAGAQVLSAARAGDEAAFRQLVDPHRRGLLAHCYRMSGSLQDAEDMVQEALVRAWRGLGGFQERSSFRTWIYRIATHATLDALRQAKARTLPADCGPAADPTKPPAPPALEMHWLEPIPDALLPSGPPEADALLSQKQSVSLAFLQALQKLPATQRAAVLLKDVIGMSADEIASLLETTSGATNSLVQRARETLKHATPPDEAEAPTELIDRYVQAWETSDVDLLVTLLRDDARVSMPPTPSWYSGPKAIAAFLGAAVLTAGSAGRFAVEISAANGMPTIVGYDAGALNFVQLLDIRDGAIFEIITYLDPSVVQFFAPAS
jgi:RNA polymerase sigma-70 factor, ECF subfamily